MTREQAIEKGKADRAARTSGFAVVFEPKMGDYDWAAASHKPPLYNKRLSAGELVIVTQFTPKPKRWWWPLPAWTVEQVTDPNEIALGR